MRFTNIITANYNFYLAVKCKKIALKIDKLA